MVIEVIKILDKNLKLRKWQSCNTSSQLADCLTKRTASGKKLLYFIQRGKKLFLQKSNNNNKFGKIYRFLDGNVQCNFSIIESVFSYC